MILWFAYLFYTSTFISGFPAQQPESGVKHGRPPESTIEHRRTIHPSSHAHSEIHRPHIAQKEGNFLDHGSLVKLSAPYDVHRNNHDNKNQTMILQLKTLISSNSENNSIIDASQSHHLHHDTLSAPSVFNNGTSEITSDSMFNDIFHLQHVGDAFDSKGLTFLNADSIKERNSSKSQFRQANILKSTVGYKMNLNSSESETNETTIVAPVTDIEKQLDSQNEIPLDLQTLLGEVDPTAIDHHQKHQNKTDILQNHENNHGDNHRDAHAHSHGDHQRTAHAHSHGEYDHTAHAHSEFHQEAHSPDHIELLAHDAKTKSNVENKLSKLLDGLTVGLFEEEDTHPHDVAVKPTTMSISRDVTNHIVTTTKRDLQELDSVSEFPNTFINNSLSVQIWNTASPTVMSSVVPSKHTYERDQSNIHSIHNMHHPAKKQKDSQTIDKASLNGVPTGRAEEKPILHSDLLQLQGIHVMFSNGKPDTTGHVPTIHLTAHTSNPLADVLDSPNTHQSDPVVLKGSINNTDVDLKSFVEKIVGTAIIKNGHLYLIVYPLGENKSVDFHFAHSAKNLTPIQPIHYTTSIPNNETSTVDNIQESITTVPSQLSTSNNTKNVSSSSPSSFQKHVTKGPRAHTAHHHENTHPQENAHQHQQQQQQHHHHHHLHRTSKKQDMQQDNKDNTKKLPPPRFLSPWESLNFSKVMPFITKQQQGDSEDNKRDIMNFVASATDPFERVISILHTLENTTSVHQQNSSTVNKLENISEADAVFNFELKLQRDLINDTHVEKQQNQVVNESSFGEQMYETNANANKNQFKLNILGSNEKDTESEMASTNTNDTLLQEYTTTDDFQSSKRPLSTHTTINYSTPKTNENNVHGSTTPSNWNTMERTSPTFNEDVNFTTQSDSDAKRQTPDSVNTTKHFLGHFETTTESPQGVLTSTVMSKSTFNTYSNYALHNGVFKTTEGTVKTPGTPITLSRGDNISDTLHKPSASNSDRQSRIQPIVRQRIVPSNVLGRGQSEQIISLADILNDIRRIQLHNMRRFNIHNNNFNTMIIGDAQDKRANLMTPAMTHKKTLSSLEITHPHHVTTAAANVQRELNRQAELNDALEAMLVLSVDDILADHTMLHGAIVLSRRSDSSNSNN